MYLFDDSPAAPLIDPVILGSLFLGLVAVAYGLLQRRILVAHPRRGADYHVFRLDLASALLWWGIAQTVAVVAWWSRVEGARMPLWSYLGLLYGATILAIAWRKERAERWSDAARAEGEAVLSDGSGRSVTSETREFGLLGAAGLALLTYLATVGHAYPTRFIGSSPPSPAWPASASV